MGMRKFFPSGQTAAYLGYRMPGIFECGRKESPKDLGIIGDRNSHLSTRNIKKRFISGHGRP